MEKKQRAWTKWLFWFSIATAVVLVYKTIDNLDNITGAIGQFFRILAPFVIGIFIAYILYIPCRKFENLYRKSKKIKWVAKKARPLSVLTVYLIALIALIIIFNCIIPPIVQSVIDLANNFQGYYNMAVQKIAELPEDSFLKSQVIARVMDMIKNIDLNKVLNTEALAQYAQGAIGFANGIINFFIAIIVSCYLLVSRKEIVNFLKRFISVIVRPKAYQNIDKYFNRSNEIFFNFLSSQIIDAIVVGILTSIAMSILGVKYAILLGFFIGLFNLIPYVGAIIAVIVAGIITFFTGGWQQALIMLIVVTILQQIDANIINPRIVGNSLKVNPLLVMLAITVGGAYFGMLGIFLSVPVAAIAKLLIEDFINYRNRKREQNREEIEK